MMMIPSTDWEPLEAATLTTVGDLVSRMYPRLPMPTILLTMISSSRQRRPLVPADGWEHRRIDIWPTQRTVANVSVNRGLLYEGWAISNEKIRDANDYGQIHFTVFQYNPLQAQHTFPIDVLASLHHPRRTVCLAVRTSHLSCGWPLHHSQTSVHERSESFKDRNTW